MSDKALSYIDIAQEDGTTNPATATTRLKAKTAGAVVTRSSAGVESELGGNLSVSSSVIAADFSTASTTVADLSALSVSVPPNKSCSFFVIANHAASSPTIAGLYGYILQVRNPAGANGSCIGSTYGKGYPSPTGAAAASSINDGDAFSLVAGGSFTLNLTLSSTPTAAVSNPTIFNGTVQNLSTTTSATIIVQVQQYAASSVTKAGSAIFALIQ